MNISLKTIEKLYGRSIVEISPGKIIAQNDWRRTPRTPFDEFCTDQIKGCEITEKDITKEIIEVIQKAWTDLEMSFQNCELMQGKKVLKFKSPIEANRYAKQEVLEALHSPNPFERAVITKGNTVPLMPNGSERGVRLYDFMDNRLDGNLFHGHPNGLPLSFDDFEMLHNHNRLSKIVAYNPQGEFSMLSKTNQFKHLFERELDQLNNKFTKKQIENAIEEQNAPKSLLDTYYRLLNFREDNLEMFTNNNEKFQAIFAQENENLYNAMQSFGYTQSNARAIHKFWQEYAEKLGLSYKTNYGYL